MPPVLLRCTQRAVPVSVPLARARANAMAAVLGLRNWDWSVTIVGLPSMRRLNQQYRLRSGITDILSFPFYSDIKPGQLPSNLPRELCQLGDIVVCAAAVQAHCNDTGTRLDDRLRVLIAHGLAHLLNYTHDTDQQYAEMQRVEQALLQQVD